MRNFLKVIHSGYFVAILFFPLFIEGIQEQSIKNPKIVPDLIEVGTFFDGTKILVGAEIPQCDGVVIKLSEDGKETTLNMKGKKVFFWMNVARVDVNNAPGIYILSSTGKLEDICSKDVLKSELIGYDALKEKIDFKSNESLTGNEFEEFIKFKEKDGSYKITLSVKTGVDTEGRGIFNGQLDIPSFIPPGEYSVDIFCFRDKKLLDKWSDKIVVKDVELPLLIINLAKNSPALYGVIAIIIAMAAGIIIGLIFARKKEGSH